MPTSSPTSSAAHSISCARRHLWSHRYEHHSARRYSHHRAAVDLREWWHHLRRARRRYKWAGAAAVVVSVVLGLRKGTQPEPFDLDGNPLPHITAYLFHDGGHEIRRATRECRQELHGQLRAWHGIHLRRHDKKASLTRLRK